MAAEDDRLLLHVFPVPDSGGPDLRELAGRLRTELLELDVDAVDPVAEAELHVGAKGVGAAAGWWTVRLGTAGIRRVVDAIRDWLSRNRRHRVDIVIDGQSLTLTHATSVQQDKLVEAFLTRVDM